MYYHRGTAPSFSLQSADDITKIVEEARTAPSSCTPVSGFGWAAENEDEDDEENEKESKEKNKEEGEKVEKEEDGDDDNANDDDDDDEDVYDKTVKAVHASGEFHLS